MNYRGSFNFPKEVIQESPSAASEIHSIREGNRQAVSPAPQSRSYAHVIDMIENRFDYTNALKGYV